MFSQRNNPYCELLLECITKVKNILKIKINYEKDSWSRSWNEQHWLGFNQ